VISTHSRRRFLRLAAGASVLPSLSFLQRAPGTLWAVDAGNVRVFPRPWTVLPASTPGVRLESLRLRMPDSALVTLGDDKIWCRVTEHDPATASLEIAGSRVETQGDRRIEARVEGSLRSTVDAFLMDIESTLLENGNVVRSGRWKDEARRELV